MALGPSASTSSTLNDPPVCGLRCGATHRGSTSAPTARPSSPSWPAWRAPRSRAASTSSYLIVDSEAAEAGAFTLTLDFECVDCVDGGLVDAGPVDAAIVDSSVIDAAPVDMGIPDAGEVDAMAAPDMTRAPDAQSPADMSIAPEEDVSVADAQADGGSPPDAVARSGDDGCATTSSGGAPGWAALLLLIGLCRWRSGRV